MVTRRAEAGLPPLPADQAQPLAKQSLRFLYRILFLLYAEASPELGVLPTGAPEYERGYSLDRLRDLTLVELATPQSRTGTHLYDSLSVLFGLVEGKRRGRQIEPDTEGNYVEGLEFRSLRADLFAEEATAHIDEVGLGNERLQEVLRHLLLSKEARGKDRGFISYAELGINQLGAVYEGLMSYTGFFAETDLYEVAKGGDSSKGSWVVPVERADGIAGSDFVKATDPITGEEKPVLHRRGTFVFRLAGRERQQSASYYTPEVLTRFVVSQALEELLDQDDRRTTAAEILELTVCEPALGSGAFAIEAVRQLADEYLKRRQDELGERDRPRRVPARAAEGEGLPRAAPGLRRRPQRHRGRAGRDLALAGHHGRGARRSVVRPAPAPRQLADRRPPRGLPPRPGRRQDLAQGRARRRSASPARRRCPAGCRTSCSPPTAGAPRPMWARTSRTWSPMRCATSRTGASPCGRSRRRSRSTRWSR